MSRLEALLKSVQTRGNLDGALAIEQELNTVRSTGLTTTAGANVPELTTIRTQYEASIQTALAPIQVRHIAALNELQDQFTKRGALRDALVVRQELSLLRAAPSPDQPTPTLPPSTAPTGGLTQKPADAVKYQGRLYKVFDTVMSWHEARAKCAEMGGRLAVVRNATDNAFIISLVGKGTRDGYWLGATDEQKEGQWVWSDGSPLKYSNWGPSQPNNGSQSEHYLVFLSRDPSPKRVNTWSDQPKISLVHNPGFICEWP